MSAVTLRPEREEDAAPIFRLTKAAFRDMPFSDGDEPELVDRLRVDGDLTLSLVAEDTSGVVGHIAFSPVTISDGTTGWYGLGPISVWPERQGERIGTALMKRGLADMRAMGAKGVVLLGDPNYYARFGFEHDPQLRYPGPPPEYFQRLVLEGASPSGEVAYAPAFSGARNA